ncbi:sigma-54-dependent transcriptional regulator [Roseicitreum antarcticum]|uniref:Nif-specific regulatory protein n=1 Tax=Roseicitreum antarcticum TaxID=564137 RepID=A0A1H2XMF4_9RHOB|nr:sigma-54 dependent transcriptional regulator [Roseicitreum antarcticum]SDW94017.1 two-component system, NtrC family, C4-dicarboxylate transport response regulator DctD [Roseicitreum antarcticum]
MTLTRILLADDEEDLRVSTTQALDLAGFDVIACDTGEAVLTRVGFGFDGIVITDIRMPGLDGLSLMNRIHEIDRDIPVILITGHGDVQLAVRAMRAGAHDFVEKPFSGTQLAGIAGRALEYRQLVLENRVLRAAAGQADDLEVRLIGRTPAMVDLRRQIRTIGPSDADVLIMGETGTGKEVVARTLHDLSARKPKPFITIDCSALPETQIESELFGHEAGAFPGAMRARYGKFEHARGGTILLDDIGAMPLALQGKLLRVIQDRVITPLGANEARDLDVRFIATSRTDLGEEVNAGRFRADLFYRLNVVMLRMLPLSARADDIPLLFSKLLIEAAARHRVAEASAPPHVLAEVAARDWPGNVRELRNAADRFALGLGLTPRASDAAPPDEGARLADLVADFERSVLVSALTAQHGNLRPVYEALGLSRKSLYEKMQKYGLDKGQFSG